jgi:hypothetical protein
VRQKRTSALSAGGRSRITRSRATSQIRRRIPMTVTGKIQKFLMREETIRELGLSEQKTA